MGVDSKEHSNIVFFDILAVALLLALCALYHLLPYGVRVCHLDKLHLRKGMCVMWRNARILDFGRDRQKMG